LEKRFWGIQKAADALVRSNPGLRLFHVGEERGLAMADQNPEMQSKKSFAGSVQTLTWH
jgi:hypothetical protein